MGISRQRLGTALLVVAVVAVVGSFAVSAATAPSIGTGSGDNASDRGRTLVGTQAGGQVTMYAANGDVLWSMGGEGVDYFEPTMLKNGSVLVAYIQQGRKSCGEFQSPCSRTGFRIIDPHPKPHVTGQWSFPVRVKLNSEVHDVNPLPNGEFLLTDMAHERIMTVAPNGTITWQWNASQRYDAPKNPAGIDWLHINDVDPIGEDKYMVSVRNANQILVIERGEGVVSVINKDQDDSDDASCKQDGQLGDYHNDSGGDVLCGDPATFNHQHNPQSLGPDAVLVADSDNDRVVELHNKSGNWTVAWGDDSAYGVGYNWPRDADRLPNGNTLITDSRNNRIVEVAPNGTAVWSVDTSIWPYDADRLPVGSRQNASLLPRYGERLTDEDLPRLNATAGTPGRADNAIPLVGKAYAGLSYVVDLPLWFEPWHIAVLVVSIVLAIVGSGLVWSGRRR